MALALAVVAHGQATGTIAGVVSGPGGPLAGVTVNIVNSSGQVVGTAVTSSNGSYSVANLPPGNYTVQVAASNGKVMGTATGVATAGLTATVNVTLTDDQLAAAGIAAGGGGAGGGGGLSTKTILIIAGTTGAAIGTYVWLKDDPSPTQ